MTITAATLRRLAALDLSGEQLSGVLTILADDVEAEEARKYAQRERTRKSRANHYSNVTVTSPSPHGNMTLSPFEVSPQTPFPKTSNPKPPSPPKGGSSPGFDEFWATFPNRVGKADASKAFVRAIQRTDLETMLAALRRYAAKTDDRPWCNPATWLNQDRWADEPQAVARGSPPRGIDALINNLVSTMDDADANATTQTQGYSAAPLRLSAYSR